MKMHSALTARPVQERLDDLLAGCRPPANPEPQRVPVQTVEAIVTGLDLNAPAKPKREQPTLRRAGIPVPQMVRVERPWDRRIF